LGTGLAFVIHLRNNRLVGASLSSMVTYVIPVFAVLVGVVVLSEPLTWHQPLGALVVLAGVAVAQGAHPRRTASPGPLTNERQPTPATVPPAPGGRRGRAPPRTGPRARTRTAASPAGRGRARRC